MKNNDCDHCASLPTCISSSVILLCNPRSCCWRAVFSPLSEVICCWILLFSAFWRLKCLFLNKWNFLHFLFYSHQLIGKAFLHICCLHREHRLQSIFLAPEDLHFLLMVVEFVGDVLDLLLSIDLSLPTDFGVSPSRKLDCYWSFVLFRWGCSCRLSCSPFSFNKYNYELENKINYHFRTLNTEFSGCLLFSP